MKKLFAPLFLLGVVALFLSGCSSNTTMVGLKVELAGVASSGGRTQITWRVANPNVVPYLVSQANHKVFLDGVLVGTVSDKEALAVPAQSRAERTGVLAIAGGAAEQAMTAAASQGSAAYRLESVITIRLYGDNTDKSDLRATGTVPVSAK